MSVEIRDVAPGLWLWRQPNWEWREGDDSEPGFLARGEIAGGGRAARPLALRPSEREVSLRLEAAPPTAVVVIKPDHTRDVDLFVHWYGIRADGRGSSSGAWHRSPT